MGGDTVDCSTIYNNLGCCMFKMRRYYLFLIKVNYFRFIEANAYFKLAKAIFELELGPYHYRTKTVISFILI
jgi:hypothetical protein